VAESVGQDEYEASAEFYDYVVPYKERTDVPFYVQAAVESKGPVLEIGCGSGRVLVPVARAGISITGLDSSESMLAKCRQKLECESDVVRSRVDLCRADMRSFVLPKTYALVTMPFRPFQHLVSVSDQCSCLEAVHGHLASRGLLILDLFNPSLPALVANDIGREQAPEPEFSTPDGRRVVRTAKILRRDLAHQVNDVQMIYRVTHPDGRSEKIVHSFQMRYLFRYEAEHLLHRCGFRVREVYCDYEKHSFGFTYPGELIIVAAKASSP
jgi:SAM-dependent methyltransferase